jgi:hypothetical protein
MPRLVERWIPIVFGGVPNRPPSMNPFQDIRSKGLLHAKGLLFLVIGVVGCGTVVLEVPTLRVAFALGAGIWGICRFYYYLFYVLENYAGRDRKYAGLWDALRYVFTRR